MSKSTLALSLLASIGLSFGPRPQDSATADPDRAAVERAVRDYVEALYQVKPELIQRSVHPALEKLGLYRPSDTAPYRTPSRMTFDQLVELAGGWNRDAREGKDLTYTVDLLDVLDVTASAKLTAKWGVDHMQLAKLGGEWKIVHVLWQSHPVKN